MRINDKIRKVAVSLALAGSLFFNPIEISAQNLEEKIERESVYQKKYAVLISGRTESRHRRNINLAYEILQKNGFEKENIVILDYTGRAMYKYPVNAPAKKKDIKKVFEELGKKINNNDLLFVYVTDHGGKKNNLSTILLPGEYLDQKEFAEYIKSIKPKKGIFFFDQCFSGGFAEEIKKDNYIIFASSHPEKESKTDEILCTLGSYFLLAFREAQKYDANSDGKLSLEEAFESAKKRFKKFDGINHFELQGPFVIGKRIDEISLSD